MNRPLKKSSPSWATKPASRKPIGDLLPQHLPVAAEVVRDVRPRPRRGQPARQPERLRPRVMLMAGCRPRRRGRAPPPQPSRDEEQPQSSGHQHDHHDPAEVLGERELPADQHPQDQPQLPHEVGGGELERQRGGRRGALGEQRERDRHRRVGARGGGGARSGRQRRTPPAPLHPGRPGCARAGPTPGRSPRSRSRAPAPTRPPTPSAAHRGCRHTALMMFFIVYP